MKQICSFYFTLLLICSAQVAWGQKTDSIGKPAEPKNYRTVVSDRINEVDEQERAVSLGKMLKKADESFGKKNYFAAMKYYGYVLQSEPYHPFALKGYGESALSISALDSAESAFQRMVDRHVSPSPDYFPKMRLAEVKFRNGHYDEASDLYDEIATLPQTPAIPEEMKKKALAQRALCIWAIGDGREKPYIIRGDSCVLLDTVNVNSRELYSEYVSNIHNGKLYFSAYRFDFKKDKALPKRNTIKLLTADKADGVLRHDIKMDVAETEFNDLKRPHTAHISFGKNDQTVYYALGNYVRDSADIRFELYRRKKQTDGTWGTPENLTVVNKPGYTTTEPSVGILFGDTTETLFFVSDRPGGKGKRDIWYSSIVGDSLSAPKPLAALNTAGEDVTPFFHTPSSTLFYSTDSLRSLGGLDIYKSKSLPGGKWGLPTHLGAPINSSANDVFFVMDDQSGRGFFSNNLRGNSNNSEEGCCYDIYSVDFMKRYRAIALNDLTKKSLPFTSITLYEKGAKGELTKVDAPVAEETSNYSFVVKLNQKYVLIGQKQGFGSDTLEMKTPDELWLGEIVDTLYLRPTLNLVATVWDCEGGKPIYGAKATFIEVNGKTKSSVLPANSNRQEYKIDFEHQYQVIMEKEGYEAPDTSDVVSTVGRLVGGTLFVELELRRPDPFANFIPITLFFDNDYPKRIKATDPVLLKATDPYLVTMRNALQINPKDPAYQDTVLLNYQNTFVDYARRYDTLFIPEYVKGERGNKRVQDSLVLSDFFENEARYNESRFREFAENLEAILQQGDTVTIEIQGFASPLSNPDYNFHLTNRRTASVYNMFVNYDGGVFRYRPFPGRPGEFLGYYKPDNTGQLKFSRKPNGEAASKYKGAGAEDTSNPRTSIYDVRASRERRVEITGVSIKKTRCKPR